MSFKDQVAAGLSRLAQAVVTLHQWVRARSAVSPKDHGAVGGGVVDDTAALVAAMAAAPAYGAVDLGGMILRITAPIPRAAVGVVVRNGGVFMDNATLTPFYAFTASERSTFRDVYIYGTGVTGSAASELYQGGIFGGNTQYPAPMGVAPVSRVSVVNCTFKSLTVGIWSGGSSEDVVPVGWRVAGCNFVDMVGYPGKSEGYGVLYTPCNAGSIVDNYFENVRRHAVYLAGEASGNRVVGNTVVGCDNIAIQSNTSADQGYADGNDICGNKISGLTRSVGYGYRSSVGIGCYGKFKNTRIEGNHIDGALDTGIEVASELSGVAYASGLVVSGNRIDMADTATDSGIRSVGTLSGSICNNQISLRNGGYAVVATAAAGASTDAIEIVGNKLSTINAAAIAFRIALSAARTVRIFRNTLSGFPGTNAGRIYDTSSAGIRATDLLGNAGYYATDADMTHTAFGTTPVNDARCIRHAATLSANRKVTLTNPSGEIGAEVTIMRTGGGASSLLVWDGGTIKALSTGQWGRFVWNGAGWELAGFGSL